MLFLIPLCQKISEGDLCETINVDSTSNLRHDVWCRNSIT